MTPRQYYDPAAEAIDVEVQTYYGRRRLISGIQHLSVSSQLTKLPNSYRIGSDHQHDNYQKTSSQTYAYRQIASMKQTRECVAHVSHSSKASESTLRSEILLNSIPGFH